MPVIIRCYHCKSIGHTDKFCPYRRPDELPQDESPRDLDHAIRLFKGYVAGENGFDELDFKEYLLDVWLPQKFIERSRIKNGWNARGEK